VKGYEHYRHHDRALQTDIKRAIEWSFVKQTDMLHAMRVAQLTLILGQLSNGVVHLSDDSKFSNEFEDLCAWLKRSIAQPIDLQQMAEQVDLSVSHFRAGFCKCTGIPPGRYFAGLRMQESARLLRETTLPIKQIYRRVGFDELANFYREFRAFSSRSPADYRRHFAPRG